MAEAGPSTGHGTSSSAGASSRPNRLPFPNREPDGGISRLVRPTEGTARGNLQSLSRSVNGKYPAFVDGRRRVRSVEEVQQPYPSGLRRAYGPDDTQRRVVSGSMRGTSLRTGSATTGGTTDASTDYSSTAFSDEYDLSHEDPRILEDVQRAINLQARREARMKALHTITATKPRPYSPDDATHSSFSTHSSPVRPRIPVQPLPSTHVQGTQGGSIESEIDFSPSIGVIPPHPVPSSSNGGATLDWTGSNSEDERDKRWPLSITRRKKDKYSMGASKDVVEKQESLYADKLAAVKAKAKSHTLRKAHITAEQLRRRYVVLEDTADSTVNLLGAARWYNQREPVHQASLDNAEPLTWLKHLLDKHGNKSTSRFPWHLSALIIEEYARSRGRMLQSIPEDRVADTIPAPEASPPATHPVSPDSKRDSKSPSTDSWSWTPPSQPLEPSLSRRRRDSFDASLSFEPQVDSGRSSAGADSRRSSFGALNRHRHSLAYGTDSAQSSTHHAMFGHNISPTSSRVRDFANRMRRRTHTKSDDGLSSTRNSISEHSHEEEPSPSKGKARSRPESLQLLSRSDTRNELPILPHSASENGLSSGGEGPQTARQTSPYIPFEAPTSTRPSRGPSPNPKTPKPRTRQRRLSLPSLNQMLIREQEKRQQDADEEQERLEYEHKSQLLDDAIAQNSRTRLLLQRVGGNVREYEHVLSRLSLLLGIDHKPIPLEVLEALSHDPASVLSGTRRPKSWRAVNDVCDRIIRQRETLRSFASSVVSEETASATTDIFDGPIFSLSSSLDQLEHHRRRLAEEAEKVVAALGQVKDVHTTVKRQYNEVTAHTSLIYPQLSQIVALEESYRNKYQQFWDLGLDALTLLLDTVTPVWRNYGKVIGEDVQDFLIIPWYRHEFTGEPKRYSIASLPKRSVRHWFGLLLFSVVSLGVLALQIGAAVSSTLNFNLPWITNTGFRWLFTPFFTVLLLIQWTAVLIECSIVLAELGVVMWWLGWAVKILN